jgi:hypothetical protein
MTGGWDTCGIAVTLNFRKKNWLGKSNGSMKRVLGFSPETFNYSGDAPAMAIDVWLSALVWKTKKGRRRKVG